MKQAAEGEAIGMHRLPPEILEQILEDVVEAEFAQFNSVYGYNKLEYCEEWSGFHHQLRRKLVQNLRLINNAWCAVASRHLIPVLRIRVSSQSLARVDAILQRPNLRAGIRSIELMLAHYPDALGEDVDQLREFQQAQVAELVNNCQSAIEYMQQKEQPETKTYFDTGNCLKSHDNRYWMEYEMNQETMRSSGTASRRSPVTVKEAMSLCKQALRLYTGFRGIAAPKKTTGTETCDKLEQIEQVFEAALEEFRIRYKDQQGLVRSGKFANHVALIAKKLPNLQRMSIIDEGYDKYSLQMCPPRSACTLLDDEQLYNMVAGAMAWPWPSYHVKAMDEWPSIPLDMVALLCDVPVAIHRAGVVLRKLHISSWPVCGSIELLEPENGFLKGTQEELQQAMNGLEVFQFCPVARVPEPEGYNPVRRGRITAEQGEMMYKYLEACISGPELQKLAFYCFSTSISKVPASTNHYDNNNHNNDNNDDSNHDDGNDDQDEYYYDDNESPGFFETDALFLAIQSIKLTSIDLDWTALDATALQHIVNHLSAADEVYFRLSSVEICRGSWAGILQSLRALQNPPGSLVSSSGRLKMDLYQICGGLAHQLSYRLHCAHHPFRLAMGCGDARIKVEEAVTCYIDAQVDLNPFDPSCLTYFDPDDEE